MSLSYIDRDTILLLIGVSLAFWMLTLTVGYALIRKLMRAADEAKAPPHILEATESKFLTCGSESIHYVQVGRGPNLVLLHGIGASLFVWRYIIDELAKSYTVTALDLPGFGKSSKTAGADYGLDIQRDRVLQFLDRLDIEQAQLVGSSMGGTLALWLAMKEPARFQKVALLAPATDPTFIPRRLARLMMRVPFLHKTLNRVTMNLMLRQIMYRQELVAKETIQKYLEPYLDEGISVKTFLAAMDLLGDNRLPDCFSSYTHPVLILYGARDRMVFKKSIVRLHDLLPAAKLFVHPESGHHIMEDEPQWCAEKLREFFT